MEKGLQPVGILTQKATELVRADIIACLQATAFSKKLDSGLSAT